jgi:hypothetical protein
MSGLFATDLALRIDGDANGPSVLEAWHINEAGTVYRQQFLNGAWSAITSVDIPQLPGGACGISAGVDGVLYALACPLNSNFAGAIFQLNVQARATAVDPNDTVHQAPKLNQWTQVPGEARDVTSTTDSTIWHIGNTSIFRSR